MGARGTKKKPTKLKLLQGTHRKDRVLHDEIEPEPVISYPEPPDFLIEQARDEWRVVVPQLFELNILAKVDMAMITAYCIEWGTYMECEELMRNMGKITEAANGTPMQNPLNNIKNTALKNAIKLATEFGFTPSSRTNIGGSKKEAKDEIDELQRILKG